MFAIIKDGGKQYKVKEGLTLDIEKVEKGIGETITFDQVLLVGQDDDVKVGQPTVEGASVEAEVVDQKRGPKKRIIKFRRRKNSVRRQGHRQYYTVVKVKSIQA